MTYMIHISEGYKYLQSVTYKYTLSKH